MGYQNIFDSHAHYDDSAFDEDREALLSALPEKGVCAVINTGAAIPPDALPRLWDAYYQADASRAAKGDGLGLSIAGTVFGLHGYAYGAENTDEGPRFWFRFG